MYYKCCGLWYFTPGSVLIYFASAYDNDLAQGKINVKLVVKQNETNNKFKPSYTHLR